MSSSSPPLDTRTDWKQIDLRGAGSLKVFDNAEKSRRAPATGTRRDVTLPGESLR